MHMKINRLEKRKHYTLSVGELRDGYIEFFLEVLSFLEWGYGGFSVSTRIIIYYFFFFSGLAMVYKRYTIGVNDQDAWLFADMSHNDVDHPQAGMDLGWGKLPPLKS